jgi:hypothetical protein
VDDLITSKIRGERLESLLRQFYDAPEQKFKYKVGRLNVCEKGFFILLGLMSKSNLKPSSQLRRVMNLVKGTIQRPLKDKQSSDLKKASDPRSRSFSHAVSI